MGEYIDKQLDEIFDIFDDELIKGRFDHCNTMLQEVQIYATHTDLLIGYLTVTFPARDKLAYRSGFFKAVEKEIKKRGHYQEGLLDGLA